MTYPIEPEAVPQIRNWLASRGGVAVWQNADLGSPNVGGLAFTPATDAEGKPACSPHWCYGTTARAIATTAAEFTVKRYEETETVKVRRGSLYHGGVHRADRAKLDAALARAGAGATWQWNWAGQRYGSAWIPVKVSRLASEIPLDSLA